MLMSNERPHNCVPVSTQKVFQVTRSVKKELPQRNSSSEKPQNDNGTGPQTLQQTDKCLPAYACTMTAQGQRTKSR